MMRWVGLFGVCLVLALGLYAPTLHAFFIKDDLNLLMLTVPPYRATWLDAAAPLNNGFWRPTHQLATRALFVTFGSNPLPYHLFCLVLHSAVATAAAWLVVSVLGRPFWAGAAAALLLIGHVGTFAAGSQISYAFDSWMALALLLALGSWHRWLNGGRNAWLIGTGGALLAAFLTKETAVLIPLLMALWAPATGTRPGRSKAAAAALFGAAAIIYALIVFETQRRVSISYVSEGRLSFSPRLLLRQLPDYFASSWLPYLHFLEWPFRHLTLPNAVFWAIRLAVLVALAAAAWRFATAPRRNFVLFFPLGAALLLVPPSLIIWAPRLWYAYSSIVLICIFLGLLLADLEGRKRQALIAAIALLWLLYLPGFRWSGTVQAYLRDAHRTGLLIDSARRLASAWKPGSTIAIYNHPHPAPSGTQKERLIHAGNLFKLFLPVRRLTIQLDETTSATTRAYRFNGRELEEMTQAARE